MPGQASSPPSSLAWPLDGGRPQVSAVEPDAHMIAELRRALPEVTAMAGRAEAIPLPDASVDAVFAGQAAHWFDLDLAMPEIARVLAPGGVFAGLWNTDDDRVDWVAGLHEVSGRKNAVAFVVLSCRRERPDHHLAAPALVKGCSCRPMAPGSSTGTCGRPAR